MTYREYKITPEEVEMLREMRTLQRAFFQGDKTVIGRAKGKEREVDTFLAKFPDPQNSTELDMFEGASLPSCQSEEEWMP